MSRETHTSRPLHENGKATEVLVHSPGTEIAFSEMHPNSALFFDYIDLQAGKEQHQIMRDAITAKGTRVHLLRDVLLKGTMDENRNQCEGMPLEELRKFASNFLVYDTKQLKKDIDAVTHLKSTLTGERRRNVEIILKQLKHQVTNDYQESYRQKTLKQLPPNILVDIILNRPRIQLYIQHWFNHNYFFASIRHKITINPHSNIYFTRDQQFTTAEGVVMLNSVNREGEKDVLEFAIKKMGYRIKGRIKEGFADGGDFINCGDILFVGQGLRTTQEAVMQLLRDDLCGTDEVVVVKDLADFSMDRMHLDCFFNILDTNKVIVLKDILEDAKKMRFVDVYKKSNEVSKKKIGPYTKITNNKRFGDFLTERGFRVMTVTEEEQINYATNFLNVGGGKIVAPYTEPGYLRRLKEFGIDVEPVNVSNLTNGYGGVRCMTQVLHREPLAINTCNSQTL